LMKTAARWMQTGCNWLFGLKMLLKK